MWIFLLIFIGLPAFDLIWWRWADLRARSLPQRRAGRVAIAIWAIVQFGGFITLMISRGLRFNLPMPTAVLVIWYVWHLLVLPIFALAMIGLAIRWLVTRRRSASVAIEEEDGTFQIDRRRFLLTGAAIAAPPLLAASGLTIALPQLSSFRVRRLTIPLAALPKELNGLTIAQVSDVHVGRFTRASLLPRIAEATNQLRADLVLLTGDLIDFSLRDLPAGLDLVRRLDPRSGLCMIQGNHDLFEDRDAFDNRVKAAGVDLLLNSESQFRVRGRDVQVLGLKWGQKGDRGALFDAHAAATLPLRSQAPDAFPILLSHHPHAFDAAAAAGIPLTLAGHTHGGQLNLSDHLGAGPLMYRYWSGLYEKGDSKLVVSNGVGNWFPIRVNAPAEIVHLTLRCV